MTILSNFGGSLYKLSRAGDGGGFFKLRVLVAGPPLLCDEVCPPLYLRYIGNHHLVQYNTYILATTIILFHGVRSL